MLSLCQMMRFPDVIFASKTSAPISAGPSNQAQGKPQDLRRPPPSLLSGLTAVAEKGITLQADNVAEANLGAVDPAKTPSADFMFTLRNTSTRPIVIDRIQPSCGCTTATVTINGRLVAAGQDMPPLDSEAQANIHVHINLTGQSAGSLFKFVAVYTKDVPQPAAMLQIRGSLTKSILSSVPVPRPGGLLPATAPGAATAFPSRKLPFAGLRVVQAENVQALAPNQAQRDFGAVSALDTPSIEQTFTLNNSTATPLVLDRFQPSCHCTTAAVEGALAGAALPTLAPGQEVSVRVTVSLADLAPGPLLKSVMVFTKGSQLPAAALTLTGQLKPAVTLSSSLLDFGRVAVDKPQTLLLMATLDPRLTERGVPPTLVSNNPDIQIIPQPDVISRLKPNPKTGGKSPKAGGKAPTDAALIGSHQRTYRIKLSPAAAGPITGSLYFVSSGHDPKVSSALANATVLLLGQVTGDVAAQPSVLAFGNVRLGQGAVRQIVLSGKDPADVTSLKITSASPFLTAKLNTATPIFSGGQLLPASCVLEVTLAPQTPPGMLQTQVKILLPNGQRLLVPVSAFISPVSAMR